MRGRDIDRNVVLAHYERCGYLARKSLCEELYDAVLRRPGHIAVVAGDTELSYAELENAIANCAEYLRANGITALDNVLVQLPNRASYVVALFALLRVGAIPTLMLPSHRQAEFLSLCELLHPVAYIGSRDQLGFDGVAMVEELDPDDLGIKSVWADSGNPREGICPRHVLPDPLKASNSLGASPLSWPDPRSDALNLLSGGTTSMPKVIPRVHEAYAYNARAAAQRCGVGPDTVYLAVLSTSHDLALAQPGVIGTLLSGGTVVLCETPAFDTAFSAIEKHHVTLTSIVPAVAQVWLEASEWYPADFSSLERIIIGAATLDDKLADGLIERFGVRLHQGYGLGEGITTFTDIDDSLSVVFGTQGKPISPGDEIKIVGPEGNSLGPCEPGEILEKGPYTFFGYIGSRDTKDCFTEDGFFRTGDRGYLTAKGDLVLCGRIAEQINRLGENVVPKEVEQMLCEIPGINNAAVFGMPDTELGEKTVAAIVASPEMDRTVILKEFLNRGVARYKVPDQVVVVREIPLVNIGKADKKKLREMVAAQSEQQ